MSIYDISWIYDCDLKTNQVLRDLSWASDWLDVIRAHSESLEWVDWVDWLVIWGDLWDSDVKRELVVSLYVWWLWAFIFKDIFIVLNAIAPWE